VKNGSHVDGGESTVPGGAATRALTHILRNTSGLNLAQVVVEMRRVLRDKKFPQIPQLSSSKNADVYKTFTLMHSVTPTGL